MQRVALVFDDDATPREIATVLAPLAGGAVTFNFDGLDPDDATDVQVVLQAMKGDA